MNRLTRIDLQHIGLVCTATVVIGISSGVWGFESSNDVLDQRPKFVLSDQYPDHPGAAAQGEALSWRGIEFKTDKTAGRATRVRTPNRSIPVHSAWARLFRTATPSGFI